MRATLKLIGVGLLLNLSVSALDKAASIAYIRKAALELTSNCQMNYTTSMKMPDGKNLTARGVLAMKGANYFDSSEHRFILQDHDWYIGADHMDKTIKIINIKSRKKEMDMPGGMFHFSALLDEDTSIFNQAKFIMKDLGSNTYYLKISFEDKGVYIKQLEFKFNLSSKIPLEYSGLIDYPIEYKTVQNKQTGQEEEVPSTYAQIKFACTQIQPASNSLFDHSRIITTRQSKTVMLRYNDYITEITKKS